MPPESNFKLESQMVHPFNLVAFLHINLRSFPQPLQHNLLLRDTIFTWREVRKWLYLSPLISSFLPISGNPMFLQVVQHEAFCLWFSKSLTKDDSFYDRSSVVLQPFSTVAEKYHLPLHHTFYAQQLAAYVLCVCPMRSQRFLDILSGYFSKWSVIHDIRHLSSTQHTIV